MLNQLHMIIKKEIEKVFKERTKNWFKNVTKRNLGEMKSKKGDLTSKEIFDDIGDTNVNREKRRKWLSILAKDVKATKQSTLI